MIKERHMITRSRSLSVAAALLCLSAGAALAQSSNEQKPGQLQRQMPGVSSTEAGTSTSQPGDLKSRLAISADQRRVIREYVVQQNVAPVVVQQPLVVGRVVPADVELLPAPAAWGPTVSNYRYVYADNHIYFVEPSSRQIVQVIE
jgi:hypothetical protein